jgi:hypothetical protein
VQPFVSTLSREFGLHIQLADVSLPKEEEEHHGCGREDCGQGGCGSCGTGGGCSTCGAGTRPDMSAYFAQLREQMERNRVGLL